jgi:hypothetical protein
MRSLEERGWRKEGGSTNKERMAAVWVLTRRWLRPNESVEARERVGVQSNINREIAIESLESEEAEGAIFGSVLPE